MLWETEKRIAEAVNRLNCSAGRNAKAVYLMIGLAGPKSHSL